MNPHFNGTVLLELLDSTMLLAGGYVAKEGDNKDAEEGRPFPSHDHISALPEVPPEVPPNAKERETLNEATSLLRAAYASPNINATLADNDLERLRLAIGYLGRMESVNLAVDRITGRGLSKAAKPGADINMSVKAIIRDAEGRTLVLKDAYSADRWDLPGGHVRDGETLEEALRREVGEETGLELGEVTEREVRVLKLDKVKPVAFFDADAAGEVRLSEEHTDYAWAGDEDLRKLNLGVFKEVLIPAESTEDPQVGELEPVILEEGLVTDMPRPARGVEKQEPPRPGLVPQSGDPEHPYRWIRPTSDSEEGYFDAVSFGREAQPELLRGLGMREDQLAWILMDNPKWAKPMMMLDFYVRLAKGDASDSEVNGAFDEIEGLLPGLEELRRQEVDTWQGVEGGDTDALLYQVHNKVQKIRGMADRAKTRLDKVLVIDSIMHLQHVTASGLPELWGVRTSLGQNAALVHNIGNVLN